MTDIYRDKPAALALVRRIAGTAHGRHVAPGPLIGEAFKRAINGPPEDYDSLLKAVQTLVCGGLPTPPRLIGSIHPATVAILRHFEYQHLPSDLQVVSQPFCDLAYDLAIKFEGAELTAGLRKLLEGKDCVVRAELEHKGREDASVGEH